MQRAPRQRSYQVKLHLLPQPCKKVLNVLWLQLGTDAVDDFPYARRLTTTSSKARPMLHNNNSDSNLIDLYCYWM